MKKVFVTLNVDTKKVNAEGLSYAINEAFCSDEVNVEDVVIPSKKTQPFIFEYIGQLLINFTSDSKHIVTSCQEHDYSAEEVIELLDPILSSQKAFYTVRYSRDKSFAILRIH